MSEKANERKAKVKVIHESDSATLLNRVLADISRGVYTLPYVKQGERK